MTKNNLKCMSDGSLAYFAAAVGIVLDVSGEQKQ